MTPTWYGDAPPPPPKRGALGLVRILARGLPLALVVFGGLAVLLALRLMERPLFGRKRPWTPHITQAVCRTAMVLLGIRCLVRGKPARTAALVANHSSWLDIFALNAAARVYFVAKAEVAGWPGIGWLARATGTVFIRRARGEAAAQRDILLGRIRAGHRLLFFPEGTSTDGQRVLAFKPTLFAAFMDRNAGRVQPVALRYTAPPGEDPRFFSWWGDTAFGPHLVAVLAAPSGGRVEIDFLAPLEGASFSDRKALARAAEDRVRSGFANGVAAD